MQYFDAFDARERCDSLEVEHMKIEEKYDNKFIFDLA